MLGVRTIVWGWYFDGGEGRNVLFIEKSWNGIWFVFNNGLSTGSFRLEGLRCLDILFDGMVK